MDHLQEEKKEALKTAGEYLEKLIPGIGTLCGELRGTENRIRMNSRSSASTV